MVLLCNFYVHYFIGDGLEMDCYPVDNNHEIFSSFDSRDDVWNGLTVRFSPIISEGFDKLPQTLQEAENSEWTEIRGVDLPDSIEIVALGYKGDPRLVVFYLTKSGQASGVQIGFPTEDVYDTEEPMDYDNIDTFITRELNGVPYYTVTLFYGIDELTGARRLWFVEKNGVIEISTNTSVVKSTTDFLEKRCVTGMGMHYSKLTPESDCVIVYPWFLLADGENVVGVGLQGIGKPNSTSDRILWEDTDNYPSYYSIPDSPACFSAASDAYGLRVLHVWFISAPENLVCS